MQNVNESNILDFAKIRIRSGYDSGLLGGDTIAIGLMYGQIGVLAHVVFVFFVVFYMLLVDFSKFDVNDDDDEIDNNKR